MRFLYKFVAISPTIRPSAPPAQPKRKRLSEIIPFQSTHPLVRLIKNLIPTFFHFVTLPEGLSTDAMPDQLLLFAQANLPPSKPDPSKIDLETAISSLIIGLLKTDSGSTLYSQFHFDLGLAIKRYSAHFQNNIDLVKLALTVTLAAVENITDQEKLFQIHGQIARLSAGIGATYKKLLETEKFYSTAHEYYQLANQHYFQAKTYYSLARNQITADHKHYEQLRLLIEKMAANMLECSQLWQSKRSEPFISAPPPPVPPERSDNCLVALLRRCCPCFF